MAHAALPFCDPVPDAAVRLRWLTSAAVFAFGALSLFVPSGYSFGPVALLLASVLLAALRPTLTLDNTDRQLIVALCAYTAVVAVGILWHGQDHRTFYKPVRFWLALPVLFWVMAYPPKLSAIWSGLALGALGAGGIALWQRGQGMPRAEGYLHPIQFGNISILFGVLCLAGMAWAWQQPHRKAWCMLLGLGAASGIMASLLSGSRGGWVGLPLMLWVLYRSYGKGIPLKAKLLVSGLMVSVILGAYSLPQTGVKQRVIQAVDDIALYQHGEKVNSSVGLRFEMWQGATRLAWEKPLMGWGESDYKAGMTGMVDQGLLHPDVLNFSHAHNQFLDTLAKQGVPGLVALLMLLFLPLRLFSRDLRNDDLTVRSLATAGALLCVANIDFSLTQAGFMHKSGIMVYAFWLVIWWGALHSYRHRYFATH